MKMKGPFYRYGHETFKDLFIGSRLHRSWRLTSLHSLEEFGEPEMLEARFW